MHALECSGVMMKTSRNWFHFPGAASLVLLLWTLLACADLSTGGHVYFASALFGLPRTAYHLPSPRPSRFHHFRVFTSEIFQHRKSLL